MSWSRCMASRRRIITNKTQKMQTTQNPVIAVLPYELRYTDDLGGIRIADLICPLGSQPGEDIRTVADLQESDHLIVYCCWKSLSRNYEQLRCKVNLLVSEPPAVQARYYFLIPFFAKKFYSVMTFSDRLIRRIPNGVFHPGASRWVNTDQNLEKTGLVSIIASRKAKTQGQKLRHEVIRRCAGLGVELELFGRGYKEVEGKEEALAPYRFSVCIENSAEPNYFTEKIVDCLAQKVVPIYWGAPNIGKFFDAEGIIFCRSEAEIVNAIRNASPSEYEKRNVAIERNYVVASEFKSLDYMAAKKILDSIRV